MNNNNLSDILAARAPEITLQHVLDNSKASSGGERDVNFLRYLLDNNLLTMGESVLKRSQPDIVEEYYLERYKKLRYESDQHFLCRTVIQEELKKLGFETYQDTEVGDLEILRAASTYDIVTTDFKTIIDIGFSSARNYFRGLTDLRVKTYMITPFFDDYIDEIKFSTFVRANDSLFLDAVRDYAEGFKEYSPGTRSDILS